MNTKGPDKSRVKETSKNLKEVSDMIFSSVKLRAVDKRDKFRSSVPTYPIKRIS
jgi:hypothetical protein